MGARGAIGAGPRVDDVGAVSVFLWGVGLDAEVTLTKRGKPFLVTTTTATFNTVAQVIVTGNLVLASVCICVSL